MGEFSEALVFCEKSEDKILHQVLEVAFMFCVPFAHDFQGNRCTGITEILGIWKIQFNIELVC